MRYNQLYLDVVIRFNGDYSGYVMDISLEVTGKMNNKSFGIEVMITQSVKVSNFAKKTVAEMGFNVPIGTTWEDIEFDATTNLMEFWISPQQDNWIRYYLQPGVYRLNMDKSAYRAYNEAMEELPFIDAYVTIDNAGYYYINLLYLGSERVSIGLENLGISDITYEIISNPVDGTIIGYSEGENDINKFFFSIKDKSYLLVLDLSNSLLSASNINIIPIPNCSYELVFVLSC
ncbi:MAG: hypothetical protein MZU97_17650 [Bacillus subtilis]|nr:hypothetical protein [Bacillus subtilis]